MKWIYSMHHQHESSMIFSPTLNQQILKIITNVDYLCTCIVLRQTAYNYNQPMWCWELSIDGRDRDSRDLFKYGMWVKMLLNLAVMLYFFILELNAPTAATSHEFYYKTHTHTHIYIESCAQISVDVETLSCIERMLTKST